VLEIGDDLWPFPVPLVKTNGGWYFDTETGRDELLNRRIGNNELAAIRVMRAYVDAQREYATEDHDGDDVFGIRSKAVSSPEKRRSLLAAGPHRRLSPLGPLVVYAQAEGYGPEPRPDEDAERGPFHGYYFKIPQPARQGMLPAGSTTMWSTEYDQRFCDGGVAR
jgi:hypothetical protein